jgi:uncharacterized membrane protein
MPVVSRLKRSFVAGLLLVAPIVVTAYVLRTLVNWLFVLVDPVAQGTGLAQYTGDVSILGKLAAAVLIVAVITLLGAIASHRWGERALGGLGRVVDLVPLVNTIYGSVRQVATALGNRDSAYDRVVLVEYPREGLHVIGLVTGDPPDAARGELGDGAMAVFVPNSPNPTGGRLILVPPEEARELEMSVRAALRFVVTTGMGHSGAPIADGAPAMAREPGDAAV